MTLRRVSTATIADRVAAFRRALLHKTPARVVSDDILAGTTPFIFSDAPPVYTSLVHELSTRLRVPPHSILTVGSAQLGFSVHPDKFPRPFGPTSDIDIAIIDPDTFDHIWHAIIDWHYPHKRASLPKPDKEWLRQRRRDIYWGLFHPAHIRRPGLASTPALRRLRDISALWFNAFREAALVTGLAAHTVSGRLYRSRTHAVQYQAAGLLRIRDMIART